MTELKTTYIELGELISDFPTSFNSPELMEAEYEWVRKEFDERIYTLVLDYDSHKIKVYARKAN